MGKQIDVELPEGHELWDYDGALLIVGPKMDRIRFETIRGGLPGKLRQKVTGWLIATAAA